MWPRCQKGPKRPKTLPSKFQEEHGFCVLEGHTEDDNGARMSTVFYNDEKDMAKRGQRF